MKRAPPLGPELRRMIWPLSREEFLRRHFQSRHFVSHAPARRVQPILDALRISSVEDYLRRRDQDLKVQVWYQTREGDYAVVETAPRDALGLYRAGLTVYINAVHELAEWKTILGRQLGYEDAGSPSLFGARRGGGTRWHFDWLENFTVQLQGTKTWRVAPNRQVPLPMENWVTRQAVSDAMRAYVPDALPREAPPEEVETVRLRPGSMLYLPRGYWHTAEASTGDSLSVTFLYPPAAWVTRLLPGLRERLTALPAWREHATELHGDRRDVGKARAKVEVLLAQLREVVGQLRPEDLVPAEAGTAPRVGARTRLRRNPLAFLNVGPASEAGTRAVQIEVQSLRPQRFDLEIEPELAPVCLFVVRREASFLASEAAAAARRVPFARAAGLLRVLLEAGVLQQDGK